MTGRGPVFSFPPDLIAEPLGGCGDGVTRIAAGGMALAQRCNLSLPDGPEFPVQVGHVDYVLIPEFAPYYRWRWIQNRTMVVNIPPDMVTPEPFDLQRGPFMWSSSPLDIAPLIPDEPQM